MASHGMLLVALLLLAAPAQLVLATTHQGRGFSVVETKIKRLEASNVDPTDVSISAGDSIVITGRQV